MTLIPLGRAGLRLQISAHSVQDRKVDQRLITGFKSFPFHRPVLVLVYGNDNQWVILWLCQTLLHSKESKPHGPVRFMLEHGGFETVIAGTECDPVLFTKILNDCRPKL